MLRMVLIKIYDIRYTNTDIRYDKGKEIKGGIQAGYLVPVRSIKKSKI